MNAMFKFIPLVLSVALAAMGGAAVTAPPAAVDTTANVQAEANADANINVQVPFVQAQVGSQLDNAVQLDIGY